MNERKLKKCQTISDWYSFCLAIAMLIFLFSGIDFLYHLSFGGLLASSLGLISNLYYDKLYKNVGTTQANSWQRKAYQNALKKLVWESINVISVIWIIISCALIIGYYNEFSQLIMLAGLSYVILIIPTLLLKGNMISCFPK